MENQEVFACGMNMIYLAAYALHGKTPTKDVLDGMDLASVYKQAARHSMQAITYEALSLFVAQNGRETLSIDEALWSRWGADRVNAIRHTIGFEMERERLLHFFEKRGIWYVLLKGLVLQTYYPKIGMRQMCDNDILFDPAYRKDVCEFMKQNGYTVQMYGKEYPDVYLKSRYNFEMHHQLYVDSLVKDYLLFNRYYDKIKDRLLHEEGCRFRFTDEDFYIYSVAHSYKHYVAGGNGIRSLMDTYVFLHAVGDRMNMDYVRAELEKLGLVWYHEMIAKIANVLFDNSCKAPVEMIVSMDEAMRDIVAFFIDSGTYGTRRHLIETKLQGEIKAPRVGFWKKVGYLFTRIFPRMEFYRLNFPVAYRHKILIPVFWFYRLCHGIFCKPAQILSEWKVVFKTK